MKFSRIALVIVSALLVLTAISIWYHLLGDSVVLSNTSGHENGVLVSGQGSSGILADKAYTSASDTVDVGRLTAAASRNEVIAFTNSRPVAIMPNVQWTSGPDTVNLPFANEIEISVTVWILKTPFATQSQEAGDRCIAIAAMWTSERMGVAFAPGGCDRRDATSVTGTGEFMAFNCDKQSRLQAAIPPTSGRINMYVVDTVEVNSAACTGNGTSCGTSDFAAVGSTADAGVGIHELGHNFSLTHIDSQGVILPGFDANNIMHSASSTRQYFTEGQLFRAHFTPAVPSAQQPGSALNSVYVGARAGQPTRDCTMEACPTLEKRIWADGALPPN